jgi:LmbE family N-acetylglucosaminyl deacetylase
MEGDWRTMKKVTVISPHPDDGEFGCGGTIAKITEEGYEVTFLIFTDSDTLEKETKKSMDVLKSDYLIIKMQGRHYPKQRQVILQTLYGYNGSHKPDVVFVPSRNDIHQDHQVITMEAIRAFRKSTILGYIHSWDNLRIDENCIIPLEKRHIEKKVEALNQYESLKNRPYFNNNYILSVAKTKGMKIHTDYAETFEVIKLINI